MNYSKELIYVSLCVVYKCSGDILTMGCETCMNVIQKKWYWHNLCECVGGWWTSCSHINFQVPFIKHMEVFHCNLKTKSRWSNHINSSICNIDIKIVLPYIYEAQSNHFC